MKLLYDLFVFLYPVAARVLSLSNEKARKWVQGRKNVFDKISANTPDGAKVVWVHCASLGEFEQGRPLIEAIRHNYPGVRVVLTFFSPSGYEVQKDYSGADGVYYLPMDSKKHAQLFFDLVNPSLVVFVKYEFWYYYLHEAAKRKVPVILASGVFRSSQAFFKWYGGFQQSMLKAFAWIFVQDENSIALLQQIGIRQVSLAGDTRFDRVIQIANDFTSVPLVDAFCGTSTVIVAGSTWTEDDEALDHFANTHPDLRFIIAPHDISKERVDECLSLYHHAITFSALQRIGNVPANVNTLVIDNIGMLSRLYRYAKIALVGGGFAGDGVHNVLEAAVYGKPVVFGPVYDKFIEANQLVEAGGALSVETAIELEQLLQQLLGDESLYAQSAAAAAQYVQQQGGATNRIIHFIQEKRLLTT